VQRKSQTKEKEACLFTQTSNSAEEYIGKVQEKGKMGIGSLSSRKCAHAVTCQCHHTPQAQLNEKGSPVCLPVCLVAE
jgi:hypothetical protein